MKKKTEVILLKDIPKLGKKNQVVKVTLGFARNYLLPQGLCILNDKFGKNYIEAKMSAKERKLKKIKEMKDKIMSTLSQNILKIERKVSKKGNLYASVSVNDVIQAIKDLINIKLPDDMIILEDHIKKPGEYSYFIVFSDNDKFEFKMQIKAIDEK